MSRLEGQTVLVTGATGEIGTAISKSLAEEGARVLLHYGRNREAAETLAGEIGEGAAALSADLANPDGATSLWCDALAVNGRIDALINNAGIRTEVSVSAPLDQWQTAWQREMQVNLTSPVDLTREAILHFRKNGG